MSKDSTNTQTINTGEKESVVFVARRLTLNHTDTVYLEYSVSEKYFLNCLC